MDCGKCGCQKTCVLDTREYLGVAVKRRRECPKCGTRFTTVEIGINLLPLSSVRSLCDIKIKPD